LLGANIGELSAHDLIKEIQNNQHLLLEVTEDQSISSEDQVVIEKPTKSKRVAKK
jgi:hypothetical protein